MEYQYYQSPEELAISEYFNNDIKNIILRYIEGYIDYIDVIEDINTIQYDRCKKKEQIFKLNQQINFLLNNNINNNENNKIIKFYHKYIYYIYEILHNTFRYGLGECPEEYYLIFNNPHDITDRISNFL